MESICKNCGAHLKEGSKFCQECGSTVASETSHDDSDDINFCPNCGSEVNSSENFCEKCGANINDSEIEDERKSFIDRYKIPIAIVAIVVIVAIAGFTVSNLMTPDYSNIELPAQTVTVGSEYFKIPDSFAAVPGSFDINTEDYVFSNTESWRNSQDTINIAVMSSGYDVDLQSVVSSGGGVHKTMMGYDGYYNEHDVGDYSFTFVLDDKICVIETTSPYLFDEIEVL